MAIKLAILSSSILLLFAACITSNSDDVCEVYYSQRETKLSAEIDQIFYNGYISDHNPVFIPNEPSQDGFYIIESPEMLDSVFVEINYPGIESLFPENGILAILSLYVIFNHEFTGCVFFFSDSTLKADISTREVISETLADPGVMHLVFPVGVTFK